MKRINLDMVGMHCQSCERIIEKAARSIEGVKSVKSYFIKEVVAVEFKENIIQLNDISNSIKA